jgi:hypothetical protein
MESMEKHSGAFEEICVAYHEKKTKYEQIAEDIRLLEKELAVCRNVNQQHNPGSVFNIMPVTSLLSNMYKYEYEGCHFVKPGHDIISRCKPSLSFFLLSQKSNTLIQNLSYHNTSIKNMYRQFYKYTIHINHT